MGAVDTTYTFAATDTITSAKMNNIIDQTTITTDAIIGTTLDVASGKLKVRSSGITSNEMGANSVVTAAITDSNVTTAKIADANLTQAKLAPNVAGNGPAFAAYITGTQQLVSAYNVDTVVRLNTEHYDTSSCFDTSTYRFTPNVAGYYQINASVLIDSNSNGTLGGMWASIRKNGSIKYHLLLLFAPGVVGSYMGSGSELIYMNGSTDYIELVYKLASSTSPNPWIFGGEGYTRMSGFLARSA